MLFRLILRLNFIIMILMTSVKSEKNFYHDLNDKNWRIILHGEWMVQFYTSVSRYDTEKLHEIWQSFGEAAEELNINVGRIDVKTSPLLRTKFSIDGLPAIIHVKNGEIRHYYGHQNEEHMMYWLEKKMFYFTQPMSDWKHPDSIQMTLLAYIFQLPNFISDAFSSFFTKYVLPDWTTILLFSVITLLVVGVHAVGLIMVLNYYAQKKEQQRVQESVLSASNVAIAPENRLVALDNISSSQGSMLMALDNISNSQTNLPLEERGSNASRRSLSILSQQPTTSRRSQSILSQQPTTSRRSLSILSQQPSASTQPTQPNTLIQSNTSIQPTNRTTRPMLSRPPSHDTRNQRNLRENDRNQVSRRRRVYNVDRASDGNVSRSHGSNTESESSRSTYMQRRSNDRRTK